MVNSTTKVSYPNFTGFLFVVRSLKITVLICGGKWDCCIWSTEVRREKDRKQHDAATNRSENFLSVTWTIFVVSCTILIHKHSTLSCLATRLKMMFFTNDTGIHKGKELQKNSNCLNWKIYCDDHISLSSTTAVQIWIISYKNFTTPSSLRCFPTQEM